MTRATKHLKFSSGDLDITCQFNKRAASCFVYMKFNTTEDSLLYNLLAKYIHEKVLFNGINVVNEIYFANCSTNGILFSCSEKKIVPNIINIFSYLSKTKLTTKEAQNVFASSANFNKLHKDIKSFKVWATGKVPHFFRALTNSEDKKIEKLITGLENISPKDLDEIQIKKQNKSVKTSFDGNDKEKFDLSIMLEDTPFVFQNSEFVAIDNHSFCQACAKMNFEYGQSKIKAFFNSCGSPGAPAANDTDKQKFKAKCELILESINMLTFMISDLHGFSYKVKSIEDLYKSGLTGESKTKIKNMIKEMEKN